jgi:hypothetical protein
MNKLPVIEHLRNSELYMPTSAPLLSKHWKRRLICQYDMNSQLKAALGERTRYVKWFVCISMPILCILLVSIAHFGFLHPEHWFKGIASITIFGGSSIGLKEILIFSALMSGLTFLVKGRIFES